jgi:hypothetical protein
MAEGIFSGKTNESQKSMELTGKVDEATKHSVNAVSQNNLVHQSFEKIRHQGFSDLKKEYAAVINTLHKQESTEEQIKSSVKTITKILVTVGYTEPQVHDVLGLLLKHADSTKYLIAMGEFEKLTRLNQEIANNKITTGDQVLDRMQGWGFNDFVRAERVRFTEYTGIVASIVASAAAPLIKSAMQSIVERIRSVDDLAKQKLEELRKEDTEEKKLSPEEKRKKLREAAAKILQEEEEGEKKTGKKAPEPAPTDLSEAKTIKAEMRDEVEGIDKARKNILRKTTLDEMFRDPKFDDIFEQHRGEEIKEMVTRKYFKSGMVPVKVLDAIANIRPPDVASYGPVSQLGLLRAYRKSLEEYSQQLRPN